MNSPRRIAWLVGLPDIGRGETDLAHLRRRRVGQLAAPVADIDVPQPRQPIDHAAPGDVVKHRAPSVVDKQRRLMVVGVMQRMDQELAIGFQKLRRAVHHASKHGVPPAGSAIPA